MNTVANMVPLQRIVGLSHFTDYEITKAASMPLLWSVMYNFIYNT